MKTKNRAKRERGIFPLLLLWRKIKKHYLLHILKRSQTQRWCLLGFASLSIAVFLSPTLEVAPPTYNVGDVAIKTVRADRDLLVMDKKATERKRDEATRKVSPVYDYDPSVIPEIEGVVHAAFSLLWRYRAV